MKMFVALTASLCLIPLVLSEDIQCRDVPGVSNYKFYPIDDQLYNVVYYSNSDAFKNFGVGIREVYKIDDTVYDTYAFFMNDNSTMSWAYVVDKVDGAKIYATNINDEGNLTDKKITTTVYGFKENEYLLIYICGNGIAPDTRFALIPEENDLDDETEKELLANDAKLGFNSPLVAA